MCTLILLHRCVPEAPLMVAANRDEDLDRPSEAPALRLGGRFPVAAPQDLKAGGTWLGVNAAGLLAAITNRPVAQRDPSLRSRGLVVRDALEAESASEAALALARIPRRAYNPFNLLVADGRDALVVMYEGAPRMRWLEPGPHVIGNADPDAREVPKVARLLDGAAAAAKRPPGSVLSALAELCRGHDGGGSPLEDACIHAGGYGTRSSTLLRLGGDAEPLWWHAEGPPCRTVYQDYAFLLREFGRRAAREVEDSLARRVS